jgi:predicted GH43/DUF377 family glycosyl hydrolase
MKWLKKGLIFEPKGQFDWLITHAMLPTADRIGEDLYRIYFSGRDKLNRSRIGFLEVDMNEPWRILQITEKPVLGLGALGCFDDNGVSPTWIVGHDEKKYMYYMGWNKGSTVRASEISGLAISEDGGETFNRFSRAPILHRSDREPYAILVASCVLLEGGIWRMWYDSAEEWLNKDLPRYNIKYAESSDGVNWNRKGDVCIDFYYPGETRISRACVLKENGMYEMWYCYAIGSGGYRIGFAISEDGIHWQRKDEAAGIDVSESGWDSEMICYPFVFTHKGQKYLLYCGNGYGKTGFGYAILEQE